MRHIVRFAINGKAHSFRGGPVFAPLGFGGDPVWGKFSFIPLPVPSSAPFGGTFPQGKA